MFHKKCVWAICVLDFILILLSLIFFMHGMYCSKDAGVHFWLTFLCSVDITYQICIWY